jgi:hypothetical protein
LTQIGVKSEQLHSIQNVESSGLARLAVGRLASMVSQYSMPINTGTLDTAWSPQRSMA